MFGTFSNHTKMRGKSVKRHAHPHGGKTRKKYKTGHKRK